MIKATLGEKAPLLSVSAWVQGSETNLDQLLGQVVLIEVFQVNCPGCFVYSLPQAAEFHRKYSRQGLTVLGVATAFEDFDKNTLDNLIRLAKDGEVVGETLRVLTLQNRLKADRLPFKIPFPLAMDQLKPAGGVVDEDELAYFIENRVPAFEQLPKAHQQRIRLQVEHYFNSLEYHAETFDRFGLKGTPSHILVDKQGLLRDCAFGAAPDMEARIRGLLQE